MTASERQTGWSASRRPGNSFNSTAYSDRSFIIARAGQSRVYVSRPSAGLAVPLLFLSRGKTRHTRIKQVTVTLPSRGRCRVYAPSTSSCTW